MENQEQFDFFSIGARKVQEHYVDLQKYAEELEKQYGKDARLQFECGVALCLSQKSSKHIEEISEYLYSSGTKDIGMSGIRNNSYFGGSGISRQYDNDGKYIEPERSK